MRRCAVCLGELGDRESLSVQGTPVCRNCLSLSPNRDHPALVYVTLALVVGLVACAGLVALVVMLAR